MDPSVGESEEMSKMLSQNLSQVIWLGSSGIPRGELGKWSEEMALKPEKSASKR